MAACPPPKTAEEEEDHYHYYCLQLCEYLAMLETIGSLQQIPQPSVWGTLVIGNGHPRVSSPPIKIY